MENLQLSLTAESNRQLRTGDIFDIELRLAHTLVWTVARGSDNSS
jgi:hypothetical protein